MAKEIHTVMPTKFAEINEQELMLRLAESMLGVARPPEKTREECMADLLKTDPKFYMQIKALARTSMLYVREVVAGAVDIAPGNLVN